MVKVTFNKDMLKTTFYNKTVLVTGHTGFKGSWLCIWLTMLGAKVVGYALDPYSKNDNFNICGVSDIIHDVRADIRDFEYLQKVVCEYKPSMIFHLAAQPLVLDGYNRPKYTYDVNVGGTINVLECLRQYEWIRHLLVVTSDKCYENKEWCWGYRENDPMGGCDPYSSSKACAEIITHAYLKSFFSEQDNNNESKTVTSTRAGNVIGGGDWGSYRLLPDCFRSLVDHKTIELRNPRSVRPWQHVLEPLGGYLKLMCFQNHVPNISGAWNFGPSLSSIVTVEEIVEKVVKLWGVGKWENANNKQQPHEATLLSLDCSKAKFLLDWEPVLSVDDAVRWTVQWYKAFHNSEKSMYKVCRNQITNYMGKILYEE